MCRSIMASSFQTEWLRESLFRSLSVTQYTTTSTLQVYPSQVSSLKSQVSTFSHLVIPFILFESLFRSLSVLVIPFILRESLFRSLSGLVIPFILCQSLFRSLSVNKGQILKVKIRSQLSGHGTAVMAAVTQRSWCSGHGLDTAVTVSSVKSHSTSSKMRNKSVKIVNGNGKNSILISHWNLGSKKWTNKRNQIQELVDTDCPDAIFISEANLDELTPLHESVIMGYDITFPKTVVRNGTARLVLLTKLDLDFELLDNLMDDIVSSIWIKISNRGAKGLLVCGVYREHQYLNQQTDWSLQPSEQSKRWAQFLRQVENARITAACYLIGDFNLD